MVIIGKKEWLDILNRINKLEEENDKLRKDIEIYYRDKKKEERINHVSSWLGRGDGSVKRASK
jgi:hypothetical protein